MNSISISLKVILTILSFIFISQSIAKENNAYFYSIDIHQDSILSTNYIDTLIIPKIDECRCIATPLDLINITDINIERIPMDVKNQNVQINKTFSTSIFSWIIFTNFFNLSNSINLFTQKKAT